MVYGAALERLLGSNPLASSNLAPSAPYQKNPDNFLSGFYGTGLTRTVFRFAKLWFVAAPNQIKDRFGADPHRNCETISDVGRQSETLYFTTFF